MDRAVSSYRPRTSTSSTTPYTASDSTTYSSTDLSAVSNISITKRRHVHQISLPHNQVLRDGHYGKRSPHENYGQDIGIVGISLAEPFSTPPTVTGKILSSVKRAVSIKKERTPPVEEVPQHIARLPARPASAQGRIMSASSNPKRPVVIRNHSIITAHRSPFGGYTKEGDFVVTRTADGRRLPIPQPHPHAYNNSRVAHPPPPIHSALKKGSSTVSVESGDSYTLVSTPDSASSAGSVYAKDLSGLTRNKSLLARLVSKSHRKTNSAPMISEEDMSSHVAKKAVRFVEETASTA